MTGHPRDLALGIAALCLIVFGPLAAASEAPKKVLMLLDERSDWDANILVERGIRTTFNQQVDVRPDVYSEYIGTWDQLAQEDYQLFLSEFLKHKYGGQKFDVIIGVAAAPLRFLRAHAAEIFPNTPIVAWAGREVVEEWGAGPPMTGVKDRLDFRGTVEMVLRLQPNLQRLIVVSGASSRDLRYEALAREDLRQYEHRITLTYLSGLSLVDIQHRLVNLPNGTAILLTNISEDGSGKKFLPDQVVSELAQVANAPIYGVQFLFLGRGIVGGSLFNQEILGREAALVALRVLRGERAQDIPVSEGSSNSSMFDWRQLQRWGFRERDLPEGSIVAFRSPTAWAQYRGRIIVIAVLIIAQALLIVSLLVQRYMRRRAEESLLDMTGRLLRSQDDERRRIARDLHDGTGQHLSGIALSVGQVLADFPRGHDRLRQLLQDSHVASRRALDEIRAISYALHPPILDGLGLIPALRWYLDGLQKRAHLSVDFDAPTNLADASPDTQGTLFRIVQESVTNVLRHSGGAAMKVKVSNGEKGITLEIEDNGHGMTADELERVQGAASLGVGIAGMRERVRQLGGEFKISSTPSGTRVVVFLPSREEQYTTHPTG